MINTFWKAALGALLTALTILALQFGYALRHVETNLDALQQDVHRTVVQAQDTATSVSQIADKRLAATNSMLDRRAGELIRIADQRTGELLVGNDEKTGLLDLADRLGGTADKATLLAEQTTSIEQQVQKQFLNCTDEGHGNPGCLQARSLALTGEAIKTADSIRRTMKAFELAQPEVLRQIDVLLAEGNQALVEVHGIASDTHEVTSRYAHPSLKSKIIAGVEDAAKVCSVACR